MDYPTADYRLPNPVIYVIGIGYAWLGAQTIVAIYVLARRLSV